MNKLQELQSKFRVLLEYNPMLPKEVVDILTYTFKDFCVEYAKSIIPEKCEEDKDIDTTNSDDVFRMGKESSYNDLIDSLHTTIQQDSLDLPTN